MVARIGVLLALALVLVGCSSNDDREPIAVFAASSLTDVFTEIEVAFEAESANFDVQLNVAGSSALREQIRSGAPADVLAVANTAIAEELALEGLVDIEQVFATNSLTIALAPGNPAGITSVEDLANDDILLGLCSPGVPCGDLALGMFEAAAVEPSVDTEEPDVRSLLTKIEAGELDAGVVYETDVRASEAELLVVDFGLSVNVLAAYPIAAVNEGPNPQGALEFISFVFSDSGRAILAEAGFGLPE